MATKGGEERKGEAVPVPVPVVAGGSYIFGSSTINPLPIKDKPGAGSLVAHFVFLYGLGNVVQLLLLIWFQDYHTSQGDACLLDIHRPVARPAALSGGVELVAAALTLLLLFTGWWSRARPFFALPMAIVTVQHYVRFFYMCYFGGDIVRPAASVAIVAVFELAMSFLSANNMARSHTYGATAHSPSKRGSASPLLLHCASSEA